MQTNWGDVLASRPGTRLAGRLRKAKAAGADMDRVAPDYVLDGSAMTATAWISTPDVDHSDDVVEPMGCILTRYRLNPVCFFDHGETFTLPIGKSVDDNGNLSVQLSESGVSATCFFSKTLPFAAQVFELWNEGIIRATSVNFLPVQATIRKDKGDDVRPGLHVTQWELLEWGPVGIPDNPYAVAKVLDRGKLDGRPIDESLLKMRRQFAPPVRVYGKGFGGAPAVTPDGTPAHRAGAFDQPVPKPGGAGPDDGIEYHDGQLIRPGEKSLAATFSAAKNLLNTARKGARATEHPEVKALLGDVAGGAAGHVANLALAYQKHYGAQAVQKDDDDSGDDMAKARKTAGKAARSFGSACDNLADLLQRHTR